MVMVFVENLCCQEQNACFDVTFDIFHINQEQNIMKVLDSSTHYQMPFGIKGQENLGVQLGRQQYI